MIKEYFADIIAKLANIIILFKKNDIYCLFIRVLWSNYEILILF